MLGLQAVRGARNWTWLLCGVAFVATGDRAGAQQRKREALPFFGHIANAKENSALSMDCDGDPLGTINCDFTQVTVSVKDPAEVEKALREDRTSKTGRADMRATFCNAKARPRSDRSAERTALLEHYWTRFARACACHDDACFDREIDGALLTLRGCKVWTHSFKATFERVLGQRKWTSMATSGLCNDTNATIIESDDSGLKWKFTQTRLATDTSNDLCKDRVVNEPSIYSSEIDGSALLKCDVIGFGH